MSSLQTSDISAIFGKILKYHRMEQNISQEELAYLAGVDRTFISRLERGIRQPSITTLIGIGLTLGIPAAEMVRETEAEYLKRSDIQHLKQELDMIREKGQRYTRKRQR